MPLLMILPEPMSRSIQCQQKTRSHLVAGMPAVEVRTLQHPLNDRPEANNGRPAVQKRRNCRPVDCQEDPRPWMKNKYKRTLGQRWPTLWHPVPPERWWPWHRFASGSYMYGGRRPSDLRCYCIVVSLRRFICTIKPVHTLTGS